MKWKLCKISVSCWAALEATATEDQEFIPRKKKQQEFVLYNLIMKSPHYLKFGLSEIGPVPSVLDNNWESTALFITLLLQMARVDGELKPVWHFSAIYLILTFRKKVSYKIVL